MLGTFNPLSSWIDRPNSRYFCDKSMDVITLRVMKSHQIATFPCRVLGFFQIPPTHSQRRIVEAQGQRCGELTPCAGSIGGGGLDVGELVEPWTVMRKVMTCSAIAICFQNVAGMDGMEIYLDLFIEE